MARPAVVLVRPWVDAHGGTGCCSGEARDPIGLDERVGGHQHHPAEVAQTADAYRSLRAAVPDADVQIVSCSNTAYLLPTTFRSVRRRAGVGPALRAAARSTRAGAGLVDGEDIGDLSDLGPAGVVAAVRRRT